MAVRVLAAIAYYGTANRAHLEVLLDEYASMRFDVEVVVLTETRKELRVPDGLRVEQRIGLPSPDPFSLPFAHKALFAERRDDYDLFVYSEDDTLIAESHLDAFLAATAALPPDRLAGFLRVEIGRDGELRCSSVHNHYHWRAGSVFEAGGARFAEFTNSHSAGFVVTREQLSAAIASGGFLGPPRRGRYDTRETAATDPYTSCGFSKVICISQIDRFLLRHLSDRYVDSLGVPLATVRRQIDALERVAGGALSAAQLIEPATALDDGRWDKRYHAVVAPATLAAVPAGARRVLSLGSGSGNLEAELIRLGHTVTAIPLDAVIGEVAAERGVIVTSPELGAALAELSGQRFDALVADDVLARFEDPVGVLGALRPLLSPGAVVVATAPNVAKEKLRAALGRTELAAPSSFEFDRDGLHSAGPAVLGSWLRSAGYAAPRRVGGAAGLASRAVEPLRSPMHVVAARRPPGRSERPRSAGATGSNGADPTVSVGLPVYNGENYLAGCIESVLNQDFEDFELVVSDNCSTDGTEHIAREAAARDPRVRYERLDANRGAAFNYNATFRRSRGRYFTWLAHDDLRHQRFLSSCVAALDAAPASVVLVQPRARFIDAEGRDAGVDSDVLDARWPRPARRLGRVLANVNQANAVFGVIRADALERTRLIGPFIASDYVLLAELSLLGEFWQLDEELMLRRVHPGASRHANRTDAEVARWFDPAARVPRLSARQRLAIEYTRSVLRQPLSPAQRGTALLTVPTVMGARQARNALGRWRRRAMQTVAAGRGHR